MRKNTRRQAPRPVVAMPARDEAKIPVAMTIDQQFLGVIIAELRQLNERLARMEARLG